MTEQPYRAGQRKPVSPAASRPEPVYVDEAYADGPEQGLLEELGDELVTAPEQDERELLAGEIEKPVRSGTPSAPEAPAEEPGPGQKPANRQEAERPPTGSGGTFHSRIPHRHAAPKSAARRPARAARPAEPDAPPETAPQTADSRPLPGPSRRAITEADTAPQVAGREVPFRPPAAPGQVPQRAVETSEPGAGAAPVPAWVVLDRILAEHAGLPQGSLILGVQDDGRPLVLALDDVSIGAVLVTGDSAEANRKHLRAILASAEKLNPPDLLQIDVITRAAEQFESGSSVMGRICEAADGCVFDLLGEFLTEIETRLRDQRQLPFRILVLDEIEELTGRLAEDSLRFLRWMMRRGPQAGIWIFASIETGRLPEFDSKTFRTFDLRLYGRILEQAAAERYTEISPGVLKKLAAGSEGCFKFDDTVIRFSIPEFAG